MIYFPDIKETCYSLIGSKRVEGSDVLHIASEHGGERMEAYISFAKDSGKVVSNSVHAGSMNTVKPSLPDISTDEKASDGNDAIATSPAESGKWAHYVIKDKITQRPIGNYALKYGQGNF